MALNITFNGYNLKQTYTTIERVDYRSVTNFVESSRVSRLLGTKITNAQLDQKIIVIEGHIYGDSITDLQQNIDTFQQNVVGKQKTLTVQQGRSYTATTRRLSIPDRPYSQTYAPFSIDYIIPKGYSVGDLQSVVHLLASGVQNTSLITTISGILDNRPVLSIRLNGSGGIAPTNRYDITNQATGNTITVSGQYFRNDTIQINYSNFTITKSGVSLDYTGNIEALSPGSNTLTITASGTAPQEGAVISLEYNPRYY